ncbi:MAG: Holliday junction resolvase RuvX [Bacteroidia bacterium]|nr:Holliday junction resolvase RuvX [Bacteroidia bacterium]
MGRIMAIDYGTKRSGIAVTDPTRTIATALETVPSHLLLDYLAKYITAETVDLIILGEPKRLNNTDSSTTLIVRAFCKKLMEKFPEMPVEMVDERFTSKIAGMSLIESGQSRKVRRDKGVLDRVSATILLQDYLSTLPPK